MIAPAPPDHQLPVSTQAAKIPQATEVTPTEDSNALQAIAAAYEAPPCPEIKAEREHQKGARGQLHSVANTSDDVTTIQSAVEGGGT